MPEKAFIFSVQTRNISECHNCFFITLNGNRNWCCFHLSPTFHFYSHSAQKHPLLVQSCCTCVKISKECSKTIFLKLKSYSLTTTSVAINSYNCSKHFPESVPSSLVIVVLAKKPPNLQAE